MAGKLSRILVVDDDPDVCKVLREILRSEYRVLQAPDATTALRIVETQDPDIVLLDLHLGDGPDGFAVLARLKAIDPDLPVVILSSFNDTETVVRAMRAGAAYCIDKTPSADELVARIEWALRERRRALQLQAHRLPVSPFLGRGKKIEKALADAREAAHTELPVLILGETGTGKSILARQIHLWSRRRAGPFRAVNVAALPSSVLDSELFGHERGAFTGALQRHRGLFELAREGSILLDEIGDLSRKGQVKLLQVVEDGRFRRVGGEEELEVSVRVLSATHQDLAAMDETGSFRRDLFHRLAGLVINLPPLRDHPESIPILAKNHLGDAFELTDRALEYLCQKSWPGNVRELQLTLQRASVFASGARVDVGEVDRAFAQSPARTRHEDLLERPYGEALQEISSRFQRDYLEKLLKQHRGNVSKVARQARMARSSVNELIGKLDLGHLTRGTGD